MKSLFANKLYLSLVGVIVVALVATSILISDILDTPLLRGTKQVKVEMPITGGVFEGSSVTFRGKKIGRVSEIRLSSTGTAVVTATITDPVDIPAASVVKIRSLSPVGEQYIDLQPTTDSSPFLEDGATLQAAPTDIPKTLASTVININKLLRQLDPQDLKSALKGIGQALNGTGDDIGSLADQGFKLLQTLDRNYPTTQRLLRNGNVLLRIGADNAANLRQIASASAEFTTFLRNFDPRLRRLLAAGPGQIRELRMVIAAVNEVLPKFMDRTIKITDIVIARDPHFRELLRSYAPGLNTLGDALYDNAINGVLNFTSPYLCDYPQNAPRPGFDTQRFAVYPNGQCPNPVAGQSVRWAHNAPPAN